MDYSIPTMVPLIALAWYGVLLLITARQGLKKTVSRFFALYLLSMLVWSLGAFMMYIDTQNTFLWNKVMLAGIIGMPVAFFGFMRIFLLVKRRVWWLYLGCLSFAILQVINACGYLTRYVYVTEDGLIHYQFGSAVPLFGLYFVLFIGLSVMELIRGYRETRDPIERNRMKYAFLGIGAIVVGGTTNVVPALGAYPIDIAANVINALLLAYAIFRYQLLDITYAVRKGLLYSVTTSIIGMFYFIMIFLAVQLFHSLVGYQIFILSLLIAAITAVAVQPLHEKAQAWVDRLFFREKYDAHLMLQELSREVTSVIHLGELLSMILEKLVTRMHISWVDVFLKERQAGDFGLAAQKGLDGNLAHLRLGKDHPVVSWLAREEGVLTRHKLGTLPCFEVLWDEERNQPEKLGAELFIPLKAKGELVGILAVGPKLSEEIYSQDDHLTLTTLANQVAIAIENARLYEQAQQEIFDRKRAEEQIKTSLKEKEVLLKEIHHRVKNNLQVISSLLYLQSKNIKDDQTLEMFQDSQNRVRSMALVHERLYQSPDLARVDFAEYVRSLANHLFRSYGVDTNVIQLRISVDDVSLGIDTAIPCGLVINELVSNSLKHAFPDGRAGEVRVGLRVDDGQFTLMVCDTGVGLPEGLDFQGTGSLGLQLVNTLVEQIEGTVELDRSGGTAFKITFTEPGYGKEVSHGRDADIDCRR